MDIIYFRASQVVLAQVILMILSNIILCPLQDIYDLLSKFLLQPQLAHGVGPRIDAKFALQTPQHNFLISPPHPRL